MAGDNSQAVISAPHPDRRKRAGRQATDALELFQKTRESQVASYPIYRILVGFRQAEHKAE